MIILRFKLAKCIFFKEVKKRRKKEEDNFANNRAVVSEPY